MSLISSSSSSSPFAALRTFWANSASQASSLTRIATGQRINSAADDPAGLITSEQLRSMITQLQAEASTLQRADSLISTADAALGEVSSLLNDAEALAVANANRWPQRYREIGQSNRDGLDHTDRQSPLFINFIQRPGAA